MVNNKISYELCAAAEAAENGVRRTWSPEQYREYAAKLDRLVEAARERQADCGCPEACHSPECRELTAALRDTELQR